MLKNIIILILAIVILIFWTKDESEDSVSNNPDDVTIEYKCSELDEYESIPPEVLEECKNRGLRELSDS